MIHYVSPIATTTSVEVKRQKQMKSGMRRDPHAIDLLQLETYINT